MVHFFEHHALRERASSMRDRDNLLNKIGFSAGLREKLNTAAEFIAKPRLTRRSSRPGVVHALITLQDRDFHIRYWDCAEMGFETVRSYFLGHL